MYAIQWVLGLTILSSLIFVNPNVRIYTSLLCVFFPLYLSVLGFESIITTGTISIYLTFILNIFHSKNLMDKRSKLITMMVIAMISLSILTTLNFLSQGHLMLRSIKLCVHAIGAFLCFYNIYSLRFYDHDSKMRFIHRLYSIILVAMASHVIFAIILYYNQGLSGYFVIFNTLPSQEFTNPIAEDSLVKRLRDFVFESESFGEYIAAITPIALYFIFSLNKAHYLIILIILAYGSILSYTRSGIVLFCCSSALFFIYALKKSFTKAVIYSSACLIAIAASISYNIGILDNLFYRFSLNIEGGKNLLSKINRGFIVEIGDKLLSDPPVFGKGLLMPINFHNLPLTILYQYGVVGFTFYIAFLCIIIFHAVSFVRRSDNLRFIGYCALISIIVLYINEMKYEFTRYESYYQACLALLGTHCLLFTAQDMDTAKTANTKQLLS